MLLTFDLRARCNLIGKGPLGRWISAAKRGFFCLVAMRRGSSLHHEGQNQNRRSVAEQECADSNEGAVGMGMQASGEEGTKEGAEGGGREGDGEKQRGGIGDAGEKQGRDQKEQEAGREGDGKRCKEGDGQGE